MLGWRCVRPAYNQPMPIADTLLANETIVAEAKKHWMAPVRDSWKAALFLLGALILSWISPDDASGLVGTVEWILGWIVIGLVVAGVAMIGYNLIAWRTAQFAVTTLRVAHEEGLLRRRASSTMLSAVTDVRTQVPFLGSRLGYGDVVVVAQSGEAGADRMLSITEPEAFRNRILEQMAAAAASPAPPAPPPVAAAQPAAAPPPAAPPAPAPDDMATLERLAELRDSGVITAEEYEAKKAEILSRL